MSSRSGRGDGLLAVSGRGGFVGWHLRALLHADGRPWRNVDVRVPNPSLHEVAALAPTVTAVHVAGIVRGTDRELREGNVELAHRFVDALERSGASPREVVYANSSAPGPAGAYAEGKALAGEVLLRAAARWGARFTDVVIDNVFGEHGLPGHNTVTSTFCDRLARGQTLPVDSDHVRTFVHAQDVAEALVGHIDQQELASRGTTITIPELAARLRALANVYDRGEIPALPGPYDRDLLNTYRSYAFGVAPVQRLTSASDHRGAFTELVRSHGGTGQTGVSTTLPGVTRGNHFHRRKLERFVVVQGSARIVLRRVLTGERHVIDVSGDDPVAVDMPTLWAHSITNTGTSPLVTAFWTNDLFDPARPDTHQDAA
ncbi:MAG: NAD-dependent epimerase/dehydratase family protein [Curtobacterium sp.]